LSNTHYSIHSIRITFRKVKQLSTSCLFNKTSCAPTQKSTMATLLKKIPIKCATSTHLSGAKAHLFSKKELVTFLSLKLTCADSIFVGHNRMTTKTTTKRHHRRHKHRHQHHLPLNPPKTNTSSQSFYCLSFQCLVK